MIIMKKGTKLDIHLEQQKLNVNYKNLNGAYPPGVKSNSGL